MYTSTNGWRLVSGTENPDGTYSNVKIISTGIPALLRYVYNDSTAETNGWWETDSTKLNDFKTILTNEYNLYNNGNITVPNIKGAAGLYYNFENLNISFKKSMQYNKGFAKSIISNETIYDVDHTTDEITAKTLFNLIGTNAKVRLLTLPEINIEIGRDDIDSTSQISTLEDPNALYRLDQLTEQQTGIIDFTTYDKGTYWLASPYPANRNSILIIKFNGGKDGDTDGSYGVRPAIVINSGIRVKIIDTNNNGVPEIVVVN